MEKTASLSYAYMENPETQDLIRRIGHEPEKAFMEVVIFKLGLKKIGYSPTGWCIQRQEDGRAKRATAEIELQRIENEMREKLLAMSKNSAQ